MMVLRVLPCRKENIICGNGEQLKDFKLRSNMIRSVLWKYWMENNSVYSVGIGS